MKIALNCLISPKRERKTKHLAPPKMNNIKSFSLHSTLYTLHSTPRRSRLMSCIAKRSFVRHSSLISDLQGHFLYVAVLVEGRELNERHIDFTALPAVEADNHLMDGEKQVVIRLLQGLGDGVKLALVAAAVVGLRFARH